MGSFLDDDLELWSCMRVSAWLWRFLHDGVLLLLVTLRSVACECTVLLSCIAYSAEVTQARGTPSLLDALTSNHL